MHMIQLYTTVTYKQTDYLTMVSQDKLYGSHFQNTIHVNGSCPLPLIVPFSIYCVKKHEASPDGLPVEMEARNNITR